MNTVYPWREAPEAEFAVIGDPVKHSLSPQMHTAAYQALGLRHRYLAVHVAPGEVERALSRLTTKGYIGINVTVPHKEEALRWATDVEPLTQKVRAANTLRLEGKACINTDAPGFLDTLQDFELADKTALLLGAGGSARAIAVALISAGFRLFFYNRTLSKADVLARELGQRLDSIRLTPDPGGVSLIVNTTSASLHNEELPLPWDRARPGALAYDLMYSDAPTPFLHAAARFGLRTMDGRNLLVAQGARSFKWWLGIDPPRDVMLDALR